MKRKPTIKAFQKQLSDLTKLDVNYLVGKIPRKNYVKRRQNMKKHFESMKKMVALKWIKDVD